MDIEFGDYRLREGGRELIGPTGPVELSTRAFDLLRALLAQPDNVLSKDALFAAVWPGMIVEDNTLQVHMSALRKALGSGFIATVHGRGYKYAGPPPQAGRSAEASTAAPVLTPTGNIDRYRVDCVARDAEALAVRSLLAQHRLVSIVGPGGVGKTTLAVEVAAATTRPAGGTWMVDLAAVEDGALIGSTLSQAVGAPFRAGQGVIESVAAHLRNGATLVFDNCEHLREDVAAIVDALLDTAPSMQILTTSQVPLGLPRERIFKLMPFALDAVEKGGLDSPSAQFLAYCYERSGEQLTAADLPIVARLCRRLDGVALALRMAAARASTLGLDTVDRQLAEHLAGLDADWNTTLPRHRSLLASLAWSYDLLAPDDQRVLRTLSVFQGSFSLRAVAAITGAGAAERVAELVRRSLAMRDGTDRTRYRLLDSTRRFALEKLIAEGEEPAARAAHAAFVTALFEESVERWEDTPDEAWRAAYVPDGDNLRAALAWTKSQPGIDYAVLAANAWRYFVVEELGDEGFATMQSAMQLVDAAPPDMVARLRQAVAEVCRLNAMDIQAREALIPALEWFRSSQDRIRYWQTLVLLTWAVTFFRPAGEAAPLLLELKSQLDKMPASKTKAWALVATGVHLWNQRETEAGLARARAGLAMHLEMGNPIGRFRSVMNLAEILHNGGDTARSISLVEEILPELRKSGLTLHLSNHLGNLAIYCFTLGQAERGGEALLEASRYAIRDGSYWHVCQLQAAAEWRLNQREPRDAALLLGIIDRRISEWPDGRQKTEADHRAHLIDRLETALGQADVARLLQQGASLSLLDAEQLSGLPL